MRSEVPSKIHEGKSQDLVGVRNQRPEFCMFKSTPATFSS